MTSLKGDLRSIMGTPFGGVGHAVLIFSRVTRAAFNSDSVVLQLHDRIEMPEEADGKFRVDGLDPGPIRIELEGGTVHNHGWNIDLPDEGVWSLTDLVDAQVDWSPAVIGRAEAAAREARDHADRAEAGADRVGTAEQVGTWASEASSSANSAASARSGAVTARNAAQSARDAAEGHANRAATSESNAKTSETNAKQSETNAGDYAAVATTAATEAVDAMEEAALSAAAFSIYTGTGSPEGKVSAPVGSIYTDTAATNGAIRWIKVSGTGNTGWRVEYGDTGWRRLEPLGEYFTGEGDVLFRRINNNVTMKFVDVGVDTQGKSLIYLSEPGYIPAEFRGEYGDRTSFWVSNVIANPNYLITIAQGSRIRYQYTTTPGSHPGTGNQAMRGQGMWVTDQPWPSTLPGTPA